MAIVTPISNKLLENFVDFVAKKIEEYFITRNQEHVGYLGLTAASVLLLLFVVVNFCAWKFRGNLVINSILEKIGEYCVPQIIREQVGYLTDYDRNMKTLKEEVEKLDGIQNRMQDSVNEAIKNGQRIGPGVDSRLKVSKRINEEVKRFLEDEARVNKRWLCGLCPDLISRYKLSWKAKKKTQDVIELQKDKTRWSICADFESRIKIVDEIMAVLKDDNINAIGICGLGGMGKTTTVKKIDERAKAEKLFDVTVMAVVSQNPDLKNIQNEIAGNLGLKWDEQGVPRSRADQLREEMKKHKRILVILDDVWVRLDLEAVGIPFGGENQGCKVMLTSRSEDVCKQMRIRKNFKIDALSESEAWDLFKENAGNSIESPDLLSVAKEVVNECGGLPLAIVTVGRALEDKAPHHWKDALRKLRMPIPENVPDFLEDVYGKLELSYDFLKDQGKKSLLLLCCIFREDTDIPIRDLVRYGMGLLMFRGIDALADVTYRVRTLVDNLKRCNLLLDNGEEDCVRMHDVVRHVIRFKATKGKEAFMLRYGPELKEWPTEGTDEQYASVSLVSNEIHDHPRQLARPKPDLLLLEGIHRYQEVPNNLGFEGMEELKVLQMGLMVIPSSPTSLSYLTNLRALCLHGCELKSIPTIGELQMLVILSFRSSSITELPCEIGRLTHLRLLDLTYCGSLKNVSPGVISSLTRLEELYLEGSGLKWVVEEGGKAQNEVNLAELGFLSNLSALVSHLPTTKFSGGINLFDKLVRFQLLISNDKFPPFYFSAANEFQNCLVLDDVDATTLADGRTQVLLEKTNNLEIRGVRGMGHVLNNHDTATHHLFNEKVKSLCELRFMNVNGCKKLLNVFSSNLVQSLQNLEELIVQECDLLEVVFDFEGVNIEEGHTALVFPCLKKLELQSLPSLTYLFNEKVKSLCELRFMDVNGCKKLLNVFSSNLVQSLQNLEEVKVQKCDSLEVVFDFEGVNIEEGHAALVLPGLKKLELQILPSLTHLWPSQGIQGFQNLQSLVVDNCWELKYIFTPSIAKLLVKLENLRISECATVELIVGNDQEGSKENKEATKIVVFPKVKHLHLGNLPELVSFGPEPYTFKWPVLKELSLRNANVKVFTPAILGAQEQRTINMRSHEEVQEQQITFPSLVVLEIEDENNVERILNGLLPADSLCKLRQIHVFKCNDLSNAVPSNFLSALQKLEELSIEECDSLVEVFEVEGLNVKEGDRVLLPNLKKLNLEDLPELKSILKRVPEGFLFFQRLEVLQVGRCKNLRNLFSPSMVKSVEQLQELEISDCEMMTEIVTEDEGEGDEKAMDKIEFPQLRRLALESLPNLVSFSPKVNTTALNPKAIDVDSGEILPEFNLHTQIQHLFNEKVAFPSLEELELIGCGSLRNVFYPSMARGLLHLKYLNISKCKMMEEIVVKGENEEEGRTDKIVIPRLEKLKLLDLPRLTSFYQGLYPFDLPSLMHVSIYQCPKMMTFSLDSPTTPKLQKVEKGFYSGKSFWMGDLNKTIQQLFARKFTFPGETELQLLPNDDVELILHSLQPDGSLCKLREMHVEECNKLFHVVPSNLLQSFGNLEELTVLSCASLVEVFEVEGLNVEEGDRVLLPNLKELNLEDLPELKHLFNEKVLFPSLEKLILFQGLKSVRVECCNKLLHVFPSNLLQSFGNLEELTVLSCASLVEVFEVEGLNVEEGDKVLLPNLKILNLQDLPELKHLFNEKVLFPSLEKLILFQGLKSVRVECCNKLLHVFLSNLLQSFGNLEELSVLRCASLVEVFEVEGLKVEEGDRVLLPNLKELNLEDLPELKHLFNEKVLFPSLEKLILFQGLKSVRVECCNKLLHVFPSNLLQSFGNLEELTILRCASLVEVFEVEGLKVEEGDRVLLPNLKELNLEDLPELKHLFNEKVLFPSLEKLILFQGLKSVRVECCNKLLHVFPSNLLQSFGNLEELTVLSCASLVVVFEVEGLNVEEGDRVLLPNLKILNLKDLPELKHLFNEKVLFPSLEKLILFQGLKSVRVEYCNKLLHVFPSNLLQSLGNLEELTVLSCASLVEVFEVERLNVEERDTMLFPMLKKLYLKDLIELKRLFNEKVLFPSLEKLIIFRGLKSVRVKRCGSLRNLFYPLMARSLVRLEELRIEHCDMMEEIISKGEEEEKEGMNLIMVIPRLKRLELYHLPNLVSFCQGRYAFDLPSLVDVFVLDCAKMKTFSSKFVSTKGLKQVHNCRWLPPWRGSDIRQSSWMGDLNNTIQQLFQRKQITFPSLDVLEIVDEDNVEWILNGLLPVDSLCKLRQIRVFKCNKLSNVVPSNLLSTLQNLEELSIEECASLVEVFEVEGLNAEEGDRVLLPNLKKLIFQDLPKLKHIVKREPKGFLFFQRLEVLQVWRCKNLRNLFSPSMVKSVEQLQELQISVCEMMTEIVAKDEGEGDEKAINRIKFPQLRCLTLWELPNLVSFSPKVNATALNPKAIDVDSGEILQIQHLFNEKVAFPRLEELVLTGVSKINEIWCKMDHEGTIGFQYLKSLRVSDCGSLRSVFYPSMAGRLVHLEDLSIFNCKLMKEIVVKGKNEEEDRTDKIVIPQLEKLELSDLPSLKSFCQGLYPFDLPSLMHVSIDQCPKMMTFSLDSPITPKLQKVDEGYYSGKSFWMGDLNKTIQQLFPRKELEYNCDDYDFVSSDEEDWIQGQMWKILPKTPNF